MNPLSSQLNEKDNTNLHRVLNYDLLIKLADRSSCPSDKYLPLKPDLYSWDKETERRKAEWVTFYIKLYAVTNDCAQFPVFNIRKFPNVYEIGLQFSEFATATIGVVLNNNAVLFTSKTAGSIGENYSIETVVSESVSRAAISASNISGSVKAFGGDKYQMIIDVSGELMRLIPNGETTIDNAGVHWPTWTTGGVPYSEAVGTSMARIRAEKSGWAYLATNSTPIQVTGSAPNVPGLGASGYPDETLAPEWTAEPPSTTQLISYINSIGSLPISAANEGASDGSAAMINSGVAQLSL